MQTVQPLSVPSSTNVQPDIATDIPILIDFNLKYNTLSFNDKYHLQTIGTAMGTKMAPAYAIIFMEFVENFFLPFHLRPLFIKDTLMTSS